MKYEIGDDVIFVKGNCEGVRGKIKEIPASYSSMFLITIANVDRLVDKSINVEVGEDRQTWIEEFKIDV